MNDQYLQYNLEDFLADDAFVNWVLEGAAEDQWQSWMAEHPDIQTSISEAKAMVSNLRFKEIPIRPGLKKDLWQRIDQNTLAKEVSLPPSRYKRYIGLAVAASLAFMVILFYQNQPTVFTTELAMTESVTLPAQSEVTLSPVSRISYQEKKWSSQRNVSLTGKGHFKVSKGVPFTVRTDNGSVRVLGTEFDVVSDKDAFQVMVTEGRVNASSGNHEKILTAGMAFYKNPAWSGKYSLTDAWKTDNMFFAFKDESLSEVLKAIAFTFDTQIDQTAIDNTIRYTGSFDSSEGMETSLKKVLWPLKIEYQIEGNSLVLSPK